MVAVRTVHAECQISFGPYTYDRCRRLTVHKINRSIDVLKIFGACKDYCGASEIAFADLDSQKLDRISCVPKAGRVDQPKRPLPAVDDRFERIARGAWNLSYNRSRSPQ